MEQTYVETNVKKRVTASVVILKVVLIIAVLLLFWLTVWVRLLMILALGGAVFLFWYWPRFHEEWEYIYCDGQLDFDLIQGGERRKHKQRIELEHADVVAPIDSSKLEGYRHLTKLDYSSLQPDADLYGIVTKVADQGDKVMILFEPDDRLIQAMYAKRPSIVERG